MKNRKLPQIIFGLWIGAVWIPAGWSGEVKAGKATYDKLCASCHGADGKGNPAMSKVFGEKTLNIATKEVAAKKDDDLIKVIAEGKGKMPATGKSLSKAEQKAVVDYARSLAK